MGSPHINTLIYNDRLEIELCCASRFLIFPSITMASTETAKENTGGKTNTENTAGPSLQAAQEEIQALQAKLAQLQTATASPVPMSTSSASNQPAKGPSFSDFPELQALNLDWGDMEPAMRHQLLTDAPTRAAFLAMHQQYAAQTNAVHLVGNTLVSTDSSKRPRTDAQIVQTLDVSTLTEQDLRKLMEQYHGSAVLPALNMLRLENDAGWNTLTAQFGQSARLMMDLSQQVAHLERQISRRTLILKNFPPDAGLKSLDTNLKILLERSGVDPGHIQSRTNYRFSQDECYVFVTFVTESERNAVKYFLSKQKFSWSYWDGYNYIERKLRVEQHTSSTDRIAKQPLFALADVFDKADASLRPYADPVRLHMPHLQIFSPGDESKLIAQILYSSGQYGYKAIALIHESHMQLCSQLFPQAFLNRMTDTIRLVELERAAVSQGSARSLPSWEFSVDAGGVKDALNHYPFQLSFYPIDDEQSKLLVQDPYLLLRGRPTLLNAVTMWSALGPSTPMITDDTDRNANTGGKSQYTGGKSQNKGKSKGASAQRSNSSNWNNSSWSNSSSSWDDSSWQPQDKYSSQTQWQTLQDAPSSFSKGGKGTGSSWKQQSTVYTPDQSTNWNWNYQPPKGGDGSSKGSYPPAPWTRPAPHAQGSSSGGGKANSSNTSSGKGTKNSMDTSAHLKPFDLAILYAITTAGICWCNSCGTIKGLGYHCNDCTPHRWPTCSYASCSFPLGCNSNCDLCKDHLQWCRSKLEPTPRVFIRPPYELSFEVSLSKFLYDWNPFQQEYVQSHTKFLDSISVDVSLAQTLKSLCIPTWMPGYVKSVIEVTNYDIVYQMAPYWPWKDTKLHKLYADGDGNHAYLIPDANPSNHFPILSLFMVMLQALFAAQIAAGMILFPLSSAPPEYVPYTDLVPWGKMVYYSWLQFTSTLDSSPATFDSFTLETVLLTQYKSLTMESWLWYFVQWLLSKQVYIDMLTGNNFSKKIIKSLANPGSILFDTMSAITAHCYSLPNATLEAAANETFRWLYDQLAQHSSTGISNDTISYCLQRETNDKGNTMESLMLDIFTDGNHSLLWFTSYIVYRSSYDTTQSFAHSLH